MGITLAKGLVTRVVSAVGEQFLKQDKLPAKVNYVDWWPATCQKIKETAKSFWARRIEGATATGVCDGFLLGAWLLSFKYPKCQVVENVARKTTVAFVNQFSSGWKSTDPGVHPMSVMLFPSIIGAATPFVLGSYDIIRKHLAKDPLLDIKPIFSNEVQSILDQFTEETRTAVEEGLHKQNVLLYGPPGTGKTMVSKWIAQHSNMNYICVSGGDLLKSMKGSDDVTAFEDLITHASNLASPTIIFIDEAEVFCSEREKGKVTKASALFTAFLSKTSKPDSKIMFILATNRLEDMDKALVDRCPYKIHIDLPGLEERKRIIASTVEILFKQEQRESIFTDEMISHIATETPDFSGRSIFYLLNRLRARVGKGQTITRQNVNKSIQDFAKQQKVVEKQSQAIR